MDRIKIYLDTSVISYLYQQDAKEKMKITLELWDYLKIGIFDICLSKLVFEELKNCLIEKQLIIDSYLNNIEYTILKANEESEKISNLLLENQVLSPRSINDCKHLSLAISNNCDYILSWNFRHFVRPRTNVGAKKISKELNFKLLDITSPEVFLKYVKEGSIWEKKKN